MEEERREPTWPVRWVLEKSTSLSLPTAALTIDGEQIDVVNEIAHASRVQGLDIDTSGSYFWFSELPTSVEM
jgi:hypothetical protein